MPAASICSILAREAGAWQSIKLVPISDSPLGAKVAHERSFIYTILVSRSHTVTAQGNSFNQFFIIIGLFFYKYRASGRQIG